DVCSSDLYWMNYWNCLSCCCWNLKHSSLNCLNLNCLNCLSYLRCLNLSCSSCLSCLSLNYQSLNCLNPNCWSLSYWNHLKSTHLSSSRQNLNLIHHRSCLHHCHRSHRIPVLELLKQLGLPLLDLISRCLLFPGHFFYLPVFVFYLFVLFSLILVHLSDCPLFP